MYILHLSREYSNESIHGPIKYQTYEWKIELGFSNIIFIRLFVFISVEITYDYNSYETSYHTNYKLKRYSLVIDEITENSWEKRWCID